MNPRPTALIADDEPLLREELGRLLAITWPELNVVALARNGREALRRFEALHPDVCFLDVRMPGLSGVDVARRIGGRAHVVFVTAFDEYAVTAFAQGAVDYLLKPVEQGRLAATVGRLRERMAAAAPAPLPPGLVRDLLAHLGRPESPSFLQWIRAQAGSSVRLIAVGDIDYLRSDHKYTRIAWRDEGGRAAEALVRLSLQDLAAQLDPSRFVRVHRSVVVNLAAVSHVVHEDNETARLYLKRRPEALPVSRSHVHLFRQM